MPYIRELGQFFITRIWEHSVDIKHERVQKSTLGKHSSSTKHHIYLKTAKIVSKEENYFKMKLKETISISYHPIKLNRDDGWSINHL